MGGLIRFTQGRWDLPRHSSHVAQLFSLGVMRTLCFIALVFLAFVVAGCRESAGKHFTEREAQLIDEYCTNDILGADAALAEMERLVRRDGHLVYASNGVPHQLGFIVARRSVIHSRLGDMQELHSSWSKPLFY